MEIVVRVAADAAVVGEAAKPCGYLSRPDHCTALQLPLAVKGGSRLPYKGGYPLSLHKRRARIQKVERLIQLD